MSQAPVVDDPESVGRRSAAADEGARWAGRYAERLQLTDLLVVGWAVAGAYLWRLGVLPGSFNPPTLAHPVNSAQTEP